MWIHRRRSARGGRVVVAVVVRPHPARRAHGRPRRRRRAPPHRSPPVLPNCAGRRAGWTRASPRGAPPPPPPPRPPLRRRRGGREALLVGEAPRGVVGGALLRGMLGAQARGLGAHFLPSAEASRPRHAPRPPPPPDDRADAAGLVWSKVSSCSSCARAPPAAHDGQAARRASACAWSAAVPQRRAICGRNASIEAARAAGMWTAPSDESVRNVAVKSAAEMRITSRRLVTRARVVGGGGAEAELGAHAVEVRGVVGGAVRGDVRRAQRGRQHWRDCLGEPLAVPAAALGCAAYE